MLDETAVTTGGSQTQRRVEISEHLAAVLWRLQVVDALGPLPEKTMDQYRRALASTTRTVAWNIWAEARPSVSATSLNHGITLSMRFARGLPESATYLLQTSFVADAALRLGGVADTFCEKVAPPPRLLRRDEIEDWCFRGADIAGNDLFSGALVLAVRDAYMHAAVKERRPAPSSCDKKKCRLQHREFRYGIWDRYSVRDLFKACLTVWKAVRDAVSPKGSTSG
jgi:hypothetical protein